MLVLYIVLTRTFLHAAIKQQHTQLSSESFYDLPCLCTLGGCL